MGGGGGGGDGCGVYVHEMCISFKDVCIVDNDNLMIYTGLYNDCFYLCRKELWYFL